MSSKIRATKIAGELREFADWLETDEAQSTISNKELGEEGIRRWAILWMLDKQNEESQQGVRLLRSAIMVWAGEQGYPQEDARLDLLVNAVLAGD